MTKKQKAELIAQLKEIAVKNGFMLDRWGHYQKQYGNEYFRLKFMKINVRFEVKRSGGKWFNIKSGPIVKINPEAFDQSLQYRTNLNR